MTALLMKDRQATGVEGAEAYRRFEVSLEAAVRGEAIDFSPVATGPRQLLRVLIVDDHRACADTLCRLVGIWGHDVQQAYDGATGLAKAAAYRPHVVLLDIVMPDISGIEVAQQIRRQSRLKGCLMIAVTGQTDKDTRRQCMEAGIHLLLIKPVDLSNLETLLTLEYAYRLRSRQDATTDNVHLTTLQQWPNTNSYRPARSPYRILQGTVAS